LIFEHFSQSQSLCVMCILQLLFSGKRVKMVQTFFSFLLETSRENRWIGRDRPLGHLPTFSSEKLEVGLYRISLGKPFHSIFDEANEQMKKKNKKKNKKNKNKNKNKEKKNSFLIFSKSIVLHSVCRC
jgi:hypothetical protein